jgi:Holliday junction resolvase-like predicted endonuclease
MPNRFLQSIGRWIHSRGRFLFEARKSRLGWLGPAGERAAARYLQRLGYRIVARGHRQRLGEIDLIALDGECLVFVEVKTWASDADGDPSHAVEFRKQ